MKKKLSGNFWKSYTDPVFAFSELFNTGTGEYIRSECKGTGKDPFMRSFPNLLDIGIMGGCKSYSVCRAGGKASGCYQGGKPWKPENDMKFEDYKRIIDEGSKKGLQQVALGGAGNPDDHLEFENILKYTVEHGIVPNYTTSGIGIDFEKARLTASYCGAVAVSWYGQKFTVKAVEKFKEAGIGVSIHYVLSKETLDEALNLLENHRLSYEGDNVYDFNENPVKAFVFLLYKPVGCGSSSNMLGMADSEKLAKFFKLASKKHPFMVGFDSCSIPMLIQNSNGVDFSSLDTCEGGRFSAYIAPDMVMVPCSFDQERKYGVSLKDNSIEDVWNSEEFSKFRSSLALSCLGCSVREACMGGCPLIKDIVICSSSDKFQVRS